MYRSAFLVAVFAEALPNFTSTRTTKFESVLVQFWKVHEPPFRVAWSEGLFKHQRLDRAMALPTATPAGAEEIGGTVPNRLPRAVRGDCAVK